MQSILDIKSKLKTLSLVKKKLLHYILGTEYFPSKIKTAPIKYLNGVIM